MTQINEYPKEGKLPLYVRMANELISDIQSGMYIGARFFKERELTNRFNVSRKTVQACLAELESLGFLYKVNHVGYFVSKTAQKKRNLAVFYSFSEQMALEGRKPSTEIMKFLLLQGSKYLTTAMNLVPSAKVIQINRLRFADRQPIMYEKTFLPADRFPGLKRLTLAKESLYSIMKTQYQIKIDHAEEEFSASSLYRSEAEKLNRRYKDPCFRIVRTTFDQQQQIIEYTLTIAPADIFNYKVFLQN